METIDMTPTWGEIGNIFWRLAVTGEARALEKVKEDFAKVFAVVQAFKALDLTHDQTVTCKAVMAVEMAKQGFPDWGKE